MVTTFAFQLEDTRDEKRGKLIAGISTAAFFILLLLILILIKIITPIPAIPPDPEVMTVEIGLIDGSGGDAATQGGGSNGNTGLPGQQNPSEANASIKPVSPPDNGSVTDPTADNNTTASTSNHTSTSDQPTVSNDVLAALANWKKNKNAASIKIGGDGKGDPYTGGLGNGSGIDKGPGQGDPGTGGPGGHGGNSPSGDGHRTRHILSKPEIVNPTQEEGKVVVNVYVDRSGKVTRTEVNPNGTTTLNSVLRSTATQSAYNIKFDADPAGPELLLLPIDIYFTLK